MQGLADGYFVLPYTIGDYFATAKQPKVTVDRPEFKAAVQAVTERQTKLLSIKGKRTPRSFHKQLGTLLWDNCGMARNAKGLREALEQIPAIRAEFWENVHVTGENENLNVALEQAGRVADFLEFGELMAQDALEREESCGGHFREEFQTPDGEALRNDEKFTHVAAWEYQGPGKKPVRHEEPLNFEYVHLATRSYK